MAQRSRADTVRNTFPRVRTFGSAAVSGGQQFAWLWSRESILRLILSFVLASALWLYISNKQNPTIAQDYNQPLQVSLSNLPDGMTVQNTQTSDVFVRIKRTDPSTAVSPSSFHPFVDLLGLKPGLHEVRVQVPADPGIQVVQVSPAKIPVLLIPLLTRHVKVEPNVIGKPPPGYGYQFLITPNTVSVAGPQNLVPQVSKVVFDIDLSNMRSSEGAVYPVRPENTRGAEVTGHLTLTPARVHVRVTVQPFSSYTTLPVLAQVAGSPRTGFGVVSLTSSPSEVTITGSPEILSRITSVKTGVVSVAHRGGGTFRTRVPLQLPKGTSSPTRRVTVTLHLAPVESSTSVPIAVTPVNVTPGLQVSTISPARLLATIVGPSNVLRTAGRHVQATVNVYGLGIGTYTLTPTLTAHDGLHVESSYPSAVTVTIVSPNGR